MDLALPLVMHGVLPTEIVGAIFEEHAKLEWRAPAIDGQVCRLWRQIVLNTPRAWAYLEIDHGKRPGVASLDMWLRRSGTTPLHIRISRDFTPDKHINNRTFYDLLSEHHKRIAFLEMQWGGRSFFEGRDFPCLQILHVADWDPPYFLSMVPWGSMPELRSLRLGVINWCVVPLDTLTSLSMLALYGTPLISFPECSQSLTRLMLDDVSFADPLSGQTTFPSLTYLSLYDVGGFKPHISAPSLVIYHEGGYSVDESFDAPLPSLVEYGVHDLTARNSCPEKWHLSFPNILRLSIRAIRPVLLSFLGSLANQPLLLPSLQTISVGHSRRVKEIPEGFRETMESLVRRRSEACGTFVVLCVETDAPFQIPLLFGAVSGPYIGFPCALLTHARNRTFLTEDC